MSFTQVLETGLLELIGVDDAEVAQNEFSKSVSHIIGSASSGKRVQKDYNGEVYQVNLLMTESGDGTLQAITGQLIILDADPAVAAGAADLDAAEWATVIGVIDVTEDDWIVETNAAIACIVDTPIAFHPLQTLYFVWRHTDADALNTNAGDNYKLEMNAWLRYGD